MATIIRFNTPFDAFMACFHSADHTDLLTKEELTAMGIWYKEAYTGDTRWTYRPDGLPTWEEFKDVTTLPTAEYKRDWKAYSGRVDGPPFYLYTDNNGYYIY